MLFKLTRASFMHSFTPVHSLNTSTHTHHSPTPITITIVSLSHQVEETMSELHIATALVKSPVGMMMQNGSGHGAAGG